jgi:hypothetical protein
VIDIIRKHIAPAAYSVLPKTMKSDAATAVVLAIGWQESRYEHRQQVKGPARGFWQFEQRGGVHGVLGHEQTADIARSALKQLGYRHEPTPFGVYVALEHNDVLAFVFARLLLYTVPAPLPRFEQMQEGWRQYASSWRPGKPHIESWTDAWKHGWAA